MIGREMPKHFKSKDLHNLNRTALYSKTFICSNSKSDCILSSFFLLSYQLNF